MNIDGNPVQLALPVTIAQPIDYRAIQAFTDDDSTLNVSALRVFFGGR